MRATDRAGRFHLGLVVVAMAVGLSACSSISNPFGGGSNANKYTGKGERIPVIEFGERIRASDTLKGASFYLPDPQPAAAWPVPGGTVEQSVEHADAGRDFVVSWQAKTGRGSGRSTHVTAPPVAADGRVYVMDGAARVTAYGQKSGLQLWTTNLALRTRRSREAFGGGLAFADGKLYVTSGYRFVVALEANSGKLLWRTRVEAPIHAAPTVANSRVIVESVDDNLLTFDAATGVPGWTYQALPESARILAATSPAVSGDAVVASFASGELIALEANNGAVLWTSVLSKSNRNSALSEIRDIPGRPVIYKGDVFAASHSGVFSAVDLRSGEKRWELPVASITTPWAAGDVVYVTDTAGEVICASRDSGQIYWVANLNKDVKSKDRAVWSGPVLASRQLVVVSSKGQAVALDPKTGTVLKTLALSTTAPVDALMSPIAADGYLYVASQGAELTAIR